MTEDLLSHDERVRLEALAQSIASHAQRLGPAAADDDVVATATVFEQYIRGER